MQGIPLLVAVLLWIFGHGIWATVGMVATIILGAWVLFGLLVVLGVIAFVAGR